MKWAHRAIGFARVTGGASMQNQPVRQVGPLRRLEIRADLPLDMRRIGTGRVPVATPAQPSRHADHMRIDGESGHAERVAQHHVGRLAADAGQRHQRVHRIGDLAIETVTQHCGQSQQMLGLGTVEAERVDDVFDVLRIRCGQGCGIGETREQLGRDGVHPLVGRLGAEHGGYQQLQGRSEIQGAFRVRERLDEQCVLLVHPLDACPFGFAWHDAPVLLGVGVSVVGSRRSRE